MSKLAISVKLGIIGFIIVLVAISCRKKPNHEPGISTLNGKEYWEWVNPGEIGGGHVLEIFNGKLYVLWEAYSFSELFRVDGGGALTKVRRFSGMGTAYPVRDMAVVDGYLFMGGSFTTTDFGSASSGLLRMSAGESFTPIIFTTGDVNVLTEFGGDLIVGGNFNISVNGAQSIDIDRVVGTSAVGFSNSNSGDRYGLAVHNDELYTCGASYPLLKRVGNNWQTINVPGASKLYSVVSFNDELYVLGVFTGNTYAIKKLTAAGQWETLSGLSFDGSFSNNKLKVVNGRLYLIGTGYLGGDYGSLFCLNGGSWVSRNGFSGVCRDFEYYEGNYYLFTNNGLFRQAE